MDDKQKPTTCVFKPKGKGQELIERSLKLGVNVTNILNEMLEKHGTAYFEPAIKKRKSELRELLEA